MDRLGDRDLTGKYGWPGGPPKFRESIQDEMKRFKELRETMGD